MANYNNLKAGIDAVIKTNGRQEISGAALNTQLKNMIAELGAGYQFMGVATPATNPGTPDANVFYLASEAGTYTNFGGIVINENEVCALVWNGTWTKQVTGAAAADQFNQLNQRVINRKALFLEDSDFTNVLTGVVDYYATDTIDLAKEYYLKICGYRNNAKAQTVIQVYDGNDTLVEQVTWDARVNKVYEIKCAGFVFLIDSQFLPQNATAAFILYNLHLNKFVNTPVVNKDFIEEVTTPSLRWLKKPFSNNIAETKITDSLLYISAKTEIPSGLYVRYFGRRDVQPRQFYIQICNSSDTEVSSYIGQIPQDSMDSEVIVTTSGTYAFDIKFIASKTNIGTGAFTDFRDYALNLDDVFLNAQREDGGTIEEKVERLEQSPSGLLNGKTIVCFGDSITMFKGTEDKTYSDWLQEFSGATVVNCGFGGSRLTSRTTPVASPTTSTEAFAPFDISNLIEFISANDYSKLDAGLQWIINNESQWLSSQFSANLANVKSIDWSNVDVVTIFAGTNDKSAGATIGVAADDNKSTIMGAVKLISRVLLTAFPHLKIYWFTPIIRYYCNTVEERTPETFSDNSNLPDYVDAILTQSRNLKFPACDLYRTLGWNEYNFSEYFLDNDGTHPYKGFKDIGLKIDKFLQSN